MKQVLAIVLGLTMPVASALATGPGAPAVQAASGGTEATRCQAREVSGQVSLTPLAQRALELLVDPEALPEARVPVLEDYLSRPRQDAESVDFVLRNYVRLTLGNDYIRQGAFDQARSRLSEVRLDSPAGAQTALLIARSHELQGNEAAALKWYVRVGERFPANPRVLESLVNAAAKAESGNPKLAAGIYERALKKALANVEELAALKKETDPLSNILLDYPKDDGTTVGGQVVGEVLRARQAALPHLKQVLNATEKLACLEQELEAVDDQLFQVTERGARIGSFQTMLKRERGAMEQRLATLEQQLEAAYRSSEKARIGEEIERTRSRLETLDQRQAELEAQREAKTRGPQQARDALQQRQQALESHLTENRSAIERELEEVMASLRKQYLDLAGEGQMGKARMMREISLQGRK